MLYHKIINTTRNIQDLRFLQFVYEDLSLLEYSAN